MNKYSRCSLLSSRNVRWPRRMQPLAGESWWVDYARRRDSLTLTDGPKTVTLHYADATIP